MENKILITQFGMLKSLVYGQKFKSSATLKGDNFCCLGSFYLNLLTINPSILVQTSMQDEVPLENPFSKFVKVYGLDTQLVMNLESPAGFKEILSNSYILFKLGIINSLSMKLYTQLKNDANEMGIQIQKNLSPRLYVGTLIKGKDYSKEGLFRLYGGYSIKNVLDWKWRLSSNSTLEYCIGYRINDILKINHSTKIDYKAKAVNGFGHEGVNFGIAVFLDL